MKPKKQDLTFYYGSNFQETVKLYADERLELWRGTWEEWRLYEPGEGSYFKKEAYVSLITNSHIKPGTPGAQPFWSPLTRFNLSGFSLLWTIEEVLEIEIEGEELGEFTLSAVPSEFENAPKSARYFITMTSPNGFVSYPLIGTALFRKP